jgi:hypothetical protein
MNDIIIHVESHLKQSESLIKAQYKVISSYLQWHKPRYANGLGKRLISVSLWCPERLFSHRIDKIMTHLHYSENGVITSCNPTVKRAENKLVSAVIGTNRNYVLFMAS